MKYGVIRAAPREAGEIHTQVNVHSVCVGCREEIYQNPLVLISRCSFWPERMPSGPVSEAKLFIVIWRNYSNNY